MANSIAYGVLPLLLLGVCTQVTMLQCTTALILGHMSLRMVQELLGNAWAEVRNSVAIGQVVLGT